MSNILCHNGIDCTINIADLPVTEGVIRAPALVCNSSAGDDNEQGQGEEN